MKVFRAVGRFEDAGCGNGRTGLLIDPLYHDHGLFFRGLEDVLDRKFRLRNPIERRKLSISQPDRKLKDRCITWSNLDQDTDLCYRRTDERPKYSRD